MRRKNILFKLKILYAFTSICLLSSFTELTAQKIAPTANDNSYNVILGTTLTIGATNGLLQDDIDNSGSTSLIINPTFNSMPTLGNVTINIDGSFQYTPTTPNIGLESFEYQVCDIDTPDILISQFDFDNTPLTNATIGPNATSINPDVLQIDCGLHVPPGFNGGPTGLDLVIPNLSDIFNFTSFRCTFEYRDQEGVADIATAGNFRIYHIQGNSLGLQVSVINGTTGLPTNHTINLGNFLPGSSAYSIEYDEITGNVIYIANGTTTITNLAPTYSSLNTSLATDMIVGRFMDNAGVNSPSLCSIGFTDTSNPCDIGLVTIQTRVGSVITNRKITHRVKPD